MCELRSGYFLFLFLRIFLVVYFNWKYVGKEILGNVELVYLNLDIIKLLRWVENVV